MRLVDTEISPGHIWTTLYNMKTKFYLSSLANHHAVKLHMFYLLISTSPIDTTVYLLCNDNLHIGYMFLS